MTRIFAIATALTILCPTFSVAEPFGVSRISYTPGNGEIFTAYGANKPASRQVHRPSGTQFACTGEYVRCTSSSECCGTMTCQGATGTASQCR